MASGSSSRTGRSSPCSVFDASSFKGVGYFEETDCELRVFETGNAFYSIRPVSPKWMNERVRPMIQRQLMNRLRQNSFASGPLRGGIHLRNRKTLVGWLCEVAEFLGTSQETVFLAVNLLDRFLNRFPDTRLSQLQLVGVTCFWDACKFEECFVPSVEKMSELTANAFTPHEILEMEIQVLDAVDFSLMTVSPLSLMQTFLAEYPLVAEYESHQASRGQLSFSKNRYQHMQWVVDAHHPMAEYLVELSCYHPNFNTFHPSVVACSAIFLARATLNFPLPWCFELSQVFECSEEMLRSCVLLLHQTQRLCYRTPDGPMSGTWMRFSGPEKAFVSRHPPVLKLENVLP